MKSKTSVLVLLVMVFCANAKAQQNPVENLTWFQTYENMQNYFQLQWEEPAQPHDELIGYNIYRNDELYGFQTETSLYQMYSDLYGFVSNCDGSFLFMGNGGGFDIHVTAVYNPGPFESGYQQTVHSFGAALGSSGYTNVQTALYPNPTTGILNISGINLQKIAVHDTTGKLVRTFDAAPQIDLSALAKGVYIVKLFSEKSIMVDKIVID